MTAAALPAGDAPPPERLIDLLDDVRSHHPDADVELVRSAYEVAARAHEGQLRKSGDPFITHPLAVSRILAGYGLDETTIAAALLHDTVEDTDVTLEDVEARFGTEVAALIDGVTKLDRIRYESREAANAATIRKMVVAMAQDVRVLLIKLADRLHNVRTLGAMPPDKQERIAAETLAVYAPLAHRLGAQDIKHEMEEICFEILHPGPYAEISELISERAPEREIVIDKAIATIETRLAERGIDAEVSGRP
jgi:guanosine-3',5'-bis(diphosphate) 3'-pyrophosphohydrolase